MLTKFLKFYSEKFSKFLQEDGWLVCILIIFNSTVFIQDFFWGTEIRPFYEILSENIEKFIEQIHYCTFFILLLCVLINFSLSKFPRIKFFVQSLIFIVFAVSFAADIFLLYKFQLTLQENMILIVLGTNPITVKEFFQNYVLNPETILIIFVAIWLIVKAIKKLQKIFQNLPENILSKITYFTLIILIPAFVLLFIIQRLFRKLPNFPLKVQFLDVMFSTLSRQ